ncbi:MAG TPA: acyl-CoA dehydrogenase family protein [Amycolatopsis sp.]|nr:acyl-CoA dehydrogenase family protein [Amycolatopsis sp.]
MRQRGLRAAAVDDAQRGGHRAARAEDRDREAGPVLCSDMYVMIAYDNIQAHGGIGFTWEHPAYLYFRRAKSNALLFGTPDQHRELVARRMGIGSGQ